MVTNTLNMVLCLWQDVSVVRLILQLRTRWRHDCPCWGAARNPNHRASTKAQAWAYPTVKETKVLTEEGWAAAQVLNERGVAAVARIKHTWPPQRSLSLPTMRGLKANGQPAAS